MYFCILSNEAHAWQGITIRTAPSKVANFPAGWMVRPNRSTADQLRFGITGGGYHFVMGSAGTFYRSDWAKAGDFKFSARLTQKAYGFRIGHNLHVDVDQIATPK